MEDLNKHEYAIHKLTIENENLQKAQKINQTKLVDKYKHVEYENLELKSKLNAIRARKTLTSEEQKIVNNQFFNSSLAKNMYNMNGNSLGANSYIAARKFVGLLGAPVIEGQNQQPIANFSENNGNGDNGTGDKLTDDGNVQGWWLWILILERISLFKNSFSFETKDKNLKRVLPYYLSNIILGGAGIIERVKVKDIYKYKTFAAQGIKSNDYYEIEKVDIWQADLLLNKYDSKIDKPKPKTITDDIVFGTWKDNGYSIWFYVMSYLVKATDLLFIFTNRAILNKTILFQLINDNANAITEAQQIKDPSVAIVGINTSGFEGKENSEEFFENRYRIEDFGNSEEVAGSFNNYKTFIDYFDGVIGLSSSQFKNNKARSISDEIAPEENRSNLLRIEMRSKIEDILEQIKEKWEIDVELIDNLEVQEEEQESNPAFKNEQGAGADAE